MTSPAHPARRPLAAAALACGAALVAACGSTQSTTSGQALSASGAQPAPVVSLPASASPASSATPSGTAGNACTSSDLKVTIATGSGGAAAGSSYYPLNFTNTSGSSCTLDGYPGVSFVTSPSGTQIGSPATRNPAVTPATVTLAPGAVAHATLQVADAQNYSASACKPVTAHWLRIFPPNQTTAAHVSFTTLVCSANMSSSLGNPLSVDAITGGAGRAGQGL